MRQCTHVRKGIVTNQPGEYDSTRALAARSVCARQPCIDAAISWVAGDTNETAVHVVDEVRERGGQS